jgi:hypothetical protein
LQGALRIDQLVDLVRAGLAIATPRPVVVGKNRYEIPTMRISEAGWKVLAGIKSTKE